MVLFNWRKFIGLALILLMAFPLAAFAAEKKGTGPKKSVSRSSSKTIPQKRYRSPKVVKPSAGISHKKSVHRSSVKNVQRKDNRSRTDRKLKAKNPKNIAQVRLAKNPKAKGDRPRKVTKPVDEISPPNPVQYNHAKNVQPKNYPPSQVNKPAAYASRPERMTPDHGSENNVPSIWSTTDKRPEGKINHQEFSTKLTDNVLAEQTVNSPDIIQAGHITKDYPNKNSGNLDKIIMINTPISVTSYNNK
jgi:hypothetical protein